MAQISIPMDTVSLSFTVEDWISAAKARVTVQIYCSFAGTIGQTEVREEIRQALAKMHDVEWRFLNLNRFRDNAGMERWEAVVEHRIEESKLSDLRTTAKKVSRQGMKLEVKDVDFTPTAEEFEVLYAELRHRLYTKVASEIASLNASFSGRAFRLSSVQFHPNANAQRLEPTYGSTRNLRASSQSVMIAASSAQYSDDEADEADGGSGFAVSQKVVMSASAVLASVVEGFEEFPI